MQPPLGGLGQPTGTGTGIQYGAEMGEDKAAIKLIEH